MANIKLLELQNVASVREAEYSFGKFNIIKGRNGKGKTTILKAINYIFNPTRGKDSAELLNIDSESGEVMLKLDSDIQFRKRLTLGDSKGVTVKDENGTTIKSPASYVSSVVNTNSLDPLKFLSAPNKEQTKTFLHSIPLTVTTEQLSEIAGRLIPVEDGEHALEVIELVRRVIYDERTTVNRLVKEKEIHVEQLRSSLPGSIADVDVSTRLEQLEEQKQGIEAKRNARRAQYYTEAQEALEQVENTYQAKLAELQAERDRQRESIVNARESKIAEMVARSSNQYNPLLEEIATLKASVENQLVWKATKQNIELNEENLAKLKIEQSKLNASLSGLEELRESLTAELPLPGVTIVDDVLHIGGKSINSLSTAEKLKFAVKLATINAGEVKAIMVDNGECFDTESFAELCGICESENVQLFVTIVTDDESVQVQSFDDCNSAIEARVSLN